MKFTLHFVFLSSLPGGLVAAYVALLLITFSARAFGSDPTNAPTVLSISVSSVAICAGTSTTLTATGCEAPGTVRWSTAQTGSSIVVTPEQTTVYTATCSVTAAPASGTAVGAVTTTTATATVLVNPPIAVITQLIPISCAGRSDGQIVVGATGGTGTLQYQFNGQAFGATNTIAQLKAGTYPVAVRDAAGCVSRVNAVVSEPLPVTVSVTAVGAKCIGGTDGGLIAVASGGVGDYRYSLDEGVLQTSGTFFDLKASATYSLLVVDKQGCVLRQPVQIGAPAPFSIKPTIQPTRCTGSSDGSINVVVDGGRGPYQYQIGTGALQAGPVFTGLAANTYELSVRDANGCQGKVNAVVSQPAPLRLTAVAGPVNCFGPNSGSLTLTPTGGTGRVTYELTAIKPAQASNLFTGLGAGLYTIVGTDANGCTSVSSATVTKSEPLVVKATVIPAACCVCPTGAVQLTSTGGTGVSRQFQLAGQPYQTTNLVAGLRPNTYRMRVIDEVGCTDSTAVVVTDATAMTLSNGTIKGASCTGRSDGEITVQVAGGTKPFTYYWSTERRDTLKARAATQTGLAEGTYTVSVVDSNRCTAATTFAPLRAQNQSPYKPIISQSGGMLLAEYYTAGIQWYVRMGSDSGRAVANATQPTLLPVASGRYYLIITANGCPSPPSDAIDFVLTALNEPVTGFSVRVAPNPVRDRLRLALEQIVRSAVAIELLDASGRPVRQYQLPAFTGKKSVEWPLLDLPAGTYLLKADAGEKRVVSRVVVE